MAYANKIIVPEETRAAIYAAYLHGMTLPSICRQWRVTEFYARTLIRRMPTKHKATKTSPEVRAEILAAYMGRMKIAEIVKRWKVPPDYARTLARRAGKSRAKGKRT